jgi:hypothetical protein
MPNWVKSKLTFNGNKSLIDDLFKSIQKVEENGDITYIDFNTIIPMPDSLRETPSSSQIDLGIEILLYKRSGKEDELKKYLGYTWVLKENVTTIDEFIKMAESKQMFNLKDCEKALENLEKYGHKDWYSWSIENWGTKWNSSDTYRDDNYLEFYTAWSLPEPIIFELSKMFPKIQIGVEFADEDIGSNCGKFIIENGIISNYKSIDGIEACNIWGYDPVDYFPEIIRDRRIDDVLGNSNNK